MNKTKQNTIHHYTQINTNDVNNLANWMLLIYAHKIYIKETTQTDQPALFLHIYFKFNANDYPVTELYDQRDDIKVTMSHYILYSKHW